MNSCISIALGPAICLMYSQTQIFTHPAPWGRLWPKPLAHRNRSPRITIYTHFHKAPRQTTSPSSDPKTRSGERPLWVSSTIAGSSASTGSAVWPARGLASPRLRGAARCSLVVVIAGRQARPSGPKRPSYRRAELEPGQPLPIPLPQAKSRPGITTSLKQAKL